MNIEDKNSPLVSVIVITYNSAKYVLETLESVYSQTYQNIELIISDDCSTDNTINVCNEWLEKNKKRFVRTKIISVAENTGIPKNCNRGLHNANGEWIKYIAGDDALFSDYLAKCVAFLKSPSGKNINFLWTNMKSYKDTFLEENGNYNSNISKIKFNSPKTTASEQYQILLRVNPVFTVSFILNNKLLKEIGGFVEYNRLLEDLPTWLEITKKGHKIHYLDYVGVKYRIHSDSVSNSGELIKKSAKQLINPFRLLKSEMILKHYINEYPLDERMLIKYVNNVNIYFQKWHLNKKNILCWILYKTLTAIPKEIIHKYMKKHYGYS